MHECQHREMNSDVDLFCELLADAPICLDGQSLNAKRLALWTNRSVKTISDYRTGKLTIPVHIWRAVFLRLPDSRIANLILGGTCDIVRNDVLPELDDQPASYDSLLEISKMHHESMVYLADIMRDGRINEADAERLDSYNQTWRKLHYYTLGFNKALNRKFIESQQEMRL